MVTATHQPSRNREDDSATRSIDNTLARRRRSTSFHGCGHENEMDLTGMSGACNSAVPTGDSDRSGNVSIDDFAAYRDAYYSAVPETPYGSGWMSHPDAASGGSDSIVGYCGYIHNHETADYTVRSRHYSPGLGRWLERDPAGYIDGMNIYGYVQGTVTTDTDAFGLRTNELSPFQEDGGGMDCDKGMEKLGAIALAHTKRCGNGQSILGSLDRKGIRGVSGNSLSIVMGRLDDRAKRRLAEALEAIHDARFKANRFGKRFGGDPAARKMAERTNASCKLLAKAGTQLAGDTLGALGFVWDVDVTLDAINVGDNWGAICSGSSAAGGLLVLTGSTAAALGVKSGAVAIITGPGAILIVAASIGATALDLYWQNRLAANEDPTRNGHCEQLTRRATELAEKIKDAGCCPECESDEAGDD